ncbi:MAG: hypothetical protein QF464_15370 [Myxococcota bacterium]|jgi:hypothetical protein|nr:hypothetical protein [Myxococcota bacterium]
MIRSLAPLVALALLLGPAQADAKKKKKKKSEAEPTEAPAAEEVTTETAPQEEGWAAEEEPEPEPEPAAPAEVRNADLQITVSHANGSKNSGHVKRIERGTDIYAEDGWSSDEGDLKFYVEGNDEYKKITWSDVTRISVTANSSDISCLYSSEFLPWMYECSIKLKTSLTTRDGKTYVADSGHKWRFTYDDDTSVEFWLKRHYARQQDAEEVSLDQGDPENHSLYAELQAQVKRESRADLVTGVSVSD